MYPYVEGKDFFERVQNRAAYQRFLRFKWKFGTELPVIATYLPITEATPKTFFPFRRHIKQKNENNLQKFPGSHWLNIP